MISQTELSRMPAWLSALPLLARSARDGDHRLSLALASAAAALEADSERRGCRSRLCFLIAELASTCGKRTGDPSPLLCVSRVEVAKAADISLARTKRVLGYLSLSGVVAIEQGGVRVLDWPRLCKLADYDRSWTPSVALEDDDEPIFFQSKPHVEEMPALFTTAGDPACFA